MGSRIAKILVLLVLFVGSNYLFVSLMNSESTESASDLGNPTLPYIYVTVGGENVNMMQGYVKEQDPVLMRESVIPLTTDRQITLSYKAFGSNVESVSYEVVTPDGGERVGNAKIGHFRDNGDVATATFTLEEPLLMDREYPIVFTMRVDGKDVYFYSRVLQRPELIVDQYVEFVSNFYQTCLNKQAAVELKDDIQPDDTVVNNSFASVNNYSTFDLVTWGSLKPQLYRKSIPCIKEINQVTCTLTNEYLISSTTEDGKTEIYHVHEFYRLRYYNSEVLLLNFERQALQEYDPAGGISASGVELGVSTRDVQFKTDASSNIIAFVQDGGLWTFNTAAEKIAKVYTLHSEEEGSDERCDPAHYGIKILRVSEAGDIDFVVHGYFNRGKHEGRCGLLVCHYSGERVNVEEKAFIPFDGSYDLLASYVDTLSYLNTQGHYFFYMHDTLYRVDLDNGHVKKELTNIRPDLFASSKTDRYVAWSKQMDPDASDEITFLDLDSEKTKKIRGEKTQRVRPLGFINDDLIYGIANESELLPTDTGKNIFAMKKLMIESYDGAEFKEYAPNDIWIKEVAISEGLIEMERVKLVDGRYEATTSDDIMNNKNIETTLVKTDATNTNRRGTVVSLLTAMPNTNLTPLYGSAKIRNKNADITVNLKEEEGLKDERYYVYAKGTLQDIFCDPAEAIVFADSLRGVVINEKGQYVYERGNWDQWTELADADIPDIFFEETLDLDRITAALPNATVLDLSGCTLEEIKYFIGQGYPVVGRRKGGEVALLVGFDVFNTMMYNKETGEHYYEAYEDSTPAFEEEGSVFVTYLESKSTIRE